MEKMILTKENRYPSFYDDFKDDMIGVSELFNTLGGIERADCPVNVFDGNILSEGFALNTVRNIKYSDDEIYEFEKNIPDGNNFFSTLRFFRSLLKYICNRFKN